MSNLKIVFTARQMQRELLQAGLTPTPIPQGHTVTIGNLTIERGMRETSFRGCNHAVSTDRFSGERDHCAVCNKIRTLR